MRLYKRKSQKSYVRLFSLFERDLKKYHKVFDNHNYSLHYIVSNHQFSNDADIKVIMHIIGRPLWLYFIHEPFKIKRLLELYSRYFSVKDVSIVRPYKYDRITKFPVANIEIPKIEDRVSFEFFRDSSTWRTEY